MVRSQARVGLMTGVAHVLGRLVQALRNVLSLLDDIVINEQLPSVSDLNSGACHIAFPGAYTVRRPSMKASLVADPKGVNWESPRLHLSLL